MSDMGNILFYLLLPDATDHMNTSVGPCEFEFDEQTLDRLIKLNHRLAGRQPENRDGLSRVP